MSIAPCGARHRGRREWFGPSMALTLALRARASAVGAVRFGSCLRSEPAARCARAGLCNPAASTSPQERPRKGAMLSRGGNGSARPWPSPSRSARGPAPLALSASASCLRSEPGALRARWASQTSRLRRPTKRPPQGWPFLWVGGGAWFAKPSARAARRVHFEGRMPERTAPQALALARSARVRAMDGPNHSRRPRRKGATPRWPFLVGQRRRRVAKPSARAARRGFTAKAGCRSGQRQRRWPSRAARG